MNYKVSNIEWDTDGNQQDLDSLPTEVLIDVEDEDNIADELSDLYGFCVFGYQCIQE